MTTAVRTPGRETRYVESRSRRCGQMPEGLEYVDSWVEPSFNRCFQLMECSDPRLFQQWVVLWQDLIEFEIVPVVPSKETREVVAPRL